jgi:UDP-glucose 4-epimerase
MGENKKILILGGLGFIGKNLYFELIEAGYYVTLVSDKIYEGDGFINPETIRNILIGSILDSAFIEQAVVGYDVIFSFAGHSGASDSIKNPHSDLDNLKGHLNVLEACRKNNPTALLIFPSSRLVYGKPKYNPVNESHPTTPESIYAVHKLTTEQYYLLYQRLYNINCIILRIANPFGPYQRFGTNNYGILNWFIHKAITNEEISIYGDGNQKRDFLYISDLVKLLMLCIGNKKLFGNVYNVGSGTGISLMHSAEIIKEHLPQTMIKYVPWPGLDMKIETGDYISDIGLIKEAANWEPLINLEEGIIKTIRFYNEKG